MDREQLKNAAKSRRVNFVDVSDVSAKKITWNCQYCLKDYQSEKVFMNHFCKEKKKLEELQSAVGVNAYAFYTTWMKEKKRSVPPIESFASSMYYGTFIKFAKYVEKTNIPDVSRFIKLMVENGDVTPTLWCRDSIYAMYVEWYDTMNLPEEQFFKSLEQIKLLMSDYEATPATIFSVIPVKKLVEIIRKRRLSPWFLLATKSFRSFLQNAGHDDKAQISNALNLGVMSNRIRHYSEIFAEFNEATKYEGF